VGAFDQAGFAARLEWGEAGLRTLAPHVDVLIIVDVLRFTTAVEVATSRGATVFPYALGDESAAAFAAQHHAMLASSSRKASPEEPFSLSPRSLTEIPPGTRLVLPSPNGSNLTRIAPTAHHVVAGCLRNASSVAEFAKQHATLAVIAAGELRRDGSLRYSIEDLIGAGAILSELPENWRSPEAQVAVAAFQQAQHDLPRRLAECASGRELAALGLADDLALAAELDVSNTVPVLQEWGAYVAAAD
jgi:2-phosphosulfolactate phosphatase